MYRAAVDRKRDGFADVFVARRLKNKREEIDGRRGPGALAVLHEAARVAEKQLDDVGFVQIQVQGLIAQAAAHFHFDAIDIRAAGPVVFVRGEYGAAIRLPGCYAIRTSPDDRAIGGALIY